MEDVNMRPSAEKLTGLLQQYLRFYPRFSNEINEPYFSLLFFQQNAQQFLDSKILPGKLQDFELKFLKQHFTFKEENIHHVVTGFPPELLESIFNQVGIIRERKEQEKRGFFSIFKKNINSSTRNPILKFAFVLFGMTAGLAPVIAYSENKLMTALITLGALVFVVGFPYLVKTQKEQNNAQAQSDNEEIEIWREAFGHAMKEYLGKHLPKHQREC